MSGSRLSHCSARPRVAVFWSPLLAGDAVRGALRLRGFEVAEPGKNGLDFLGVVGEFRPDLVILDLDIRDGTGISRAVTILEAFPAIRLIGVAARPYTLAATSAARAGLQGCLAKEGNLSSIVETIEGAMAGEATFVRGRTPRIAQVGVQMTDEQRYAALIAKLMTPRERDVLSLLVQAAPTAEIMSRLAITRNTLRTYLERIFSKLQVHSRLQAATLAVRYGIVRLPLIQSRRGN